VVKIQVEAISVVMPSNVVGCQHFGGPCCLHLLGQGNGAGRKGIYI
jgi:hypothetical protein